MACACKVNQEIDRINRYYSYNRKLGEKNRPKVSVNIKDALLTMFIYILLLPLVPVVFIFLVFYSLFSKNKKISIRKILGFIHKVRNGRKQQIIQN